MTKNNIIWAKKLEKPDVILLRTRRLKGTLKDHTRGPQEEDGIRRYVHLGTGSYNDSTAKLYTDCGIMTRQSDDRRMRLRVFNMLSGYSEPLNWNMLSVAPLLLRTKFLHLINRETKHAKDGKPASIIAKMNSLCDKEIIAALYEGVLRGGEDPPGCPRHLLSEGGDPDFPRTLRSARSSENSSNMRDLYL